MMHGHKNLKLLMSLFSGIVWHIWLFCTYNISRLNCCLGFEMLSDTCCTI